MRFETTTRDSTTGFEGANGADRSRIGPRGVEATGGWRRLGLSVLVAVLAFPLASCTATKNPDGGWSIEFAPDMTIHALTLWDAHRQLEQLWRDCLAGTWDRPCTSEEIKDIKDSFDRVTKLLERGAGERGATTATPTV